MNYYFYILFPLSIVMKDKLVNTFPNKYII